jgi:hypothetical protein
MGVKALLSKPSNNSAFAAYEDVIAKDDVLICVVGLTYDAVVANEAESTEPVKAPMIGPVTVNDPVIVTFPNWFNEPEAAYEPLIIGLSIIIS